jgi:hypothetical protein
MSSYEMVRNESWTVCTPIDRLHEIDPTKDAGRDSSLRMYEFPEEPTLRTAPLTYGFMDRQTSKHQEANGTHST